MRVASCFVNVLEELESTESRDNLYVMKRRKDKFCVGSVRCFLQNFFFVVVTSKVSIAL